MRLEKHRMQLLSTELKNSVLSSMMTQLDSRRLEIISENKRDLDAYDPADRAMYDRLIVDSKKVDQMIEAVGNIQSDIDPIGVLRYEWTHPNGMKVLNKTAPFGTIMIIYESRPDVTIEAAVVAFKSNNKILLKGGKEAKWSNKILVQCWHDALIENGLNPDWIRLLDMNREETQAYLKNPTEAIDLIVPRGGENLIAFVKTHATCPVLISGRGNNFVYVDRDVDWAMAKNVIIESKIQKISACNSLDKVLLDKSLPDLNNKLTDLINDLKSSGVEVLVSSEIGELGSYDGVSVTHGEGVWSEEFLAMKILIGLVQSESVAIEMINRYSGGHSASIMTVDHGVAERFMDAIDAAAVYHNASTRFTDGGEFGIGAELAISTDKLHHRGPLGLHHLVTNKWYVFGNGQVRK
jgi:glutamate-5-semialdehyde dehydrogenase